MKFCFEKFYRVGHQIEIDLEKEWSLFWQEYKEELLFASNKTESDYKKYYFEGLTHGGFNFYPCFNNFIIERNSQRYNAVELEDITYKMDAEYYFKE